MKTYVITLSKQFPQGHSKAGQPTCFKDKFLKGQQCKRRGEHLASETLKLHTIRKNYELWAERFVKIERGEACLSVREWSGRPRHSKQVEIAWLTKDDGIGIQKLDFVSGTLELPCISNVLKSQDHLAANDGLSLEDWVDWFKGYDLAEPMAIIHFTPFRY